jgi:hypothetical protein
MIAPEEIVPTLESILADEAVFFCAGEISIPTRDAWPVRRDLLTQLLGKRTFVL